MTEWNGSLGGDVRPEPKIASMMSENEVFFVSELRMGMGSA